MTAVGVLNQGCAIRKICVSAWATLEKVPPVESQGSGGSMRVNSPERRDRLWLLNAFAVVLLTLLGAVGEALGYDRHLKSNTAKRLTHSLFRQGAMLYDLIPMMPEPRLRPLVERFGAMLLEIPAFAGFYGVI